MYEVKIINRDKEMILNSVSTDIEAPRAAGTIKQGINVINSFTVTILHNNPCFFDCIKERTTRIKVINTLTKEIEFNGRVLKEKKSMNENGLLQKQYICENSLGYLRDSIQMYGEYHNISVRNYLKMLIDKHNLQVEEYKQFKLGEVNVKDNNDSLYRYTSYKSTWENINEDLIDKLGGELQIREEYDGIYLDYLQEIGKHSETSLRVSHNMKSIESEIDLSDFPTRIVPLGAKLKIKDENGNETDSEERLTIININNGKIYIDYKEGINNYGINTKFIEFDDVTDEKNLIRKGKEYVDSLKLTITNKISALDLSILKLDIDSFKVGNYHKIINDLLDINYELRVIEKTIVIESPERTELTFGDRKLKLNDKQMQFLKINKDYIKLKEKLNSVTDKVSFTTNKMENIEYVIDDYVDKENYKNFVDFVTTKLNDIEERLIYLEGDFNG